VQLKLPSDLSGLTTLGYQAKGRASLKDRLAPVCDDIRKIIGELGVRA
jgi:predicted nucleotide-binding protein